MSRNRSIRNTNKGIALLMVLAIIMAVTILSLGFIARTDTELICGQNMALRVQMDQTAASGLEHARGLMVQPPNSMATGGYWPGATAQQLDPTTADFYDVNVLPDANDACNYFITCDAYRLRSADKIGRSTFAAQLRLDPCIALWTGVTTALPQATVVHGDLHCGGDLVNQGTIDGDAFAIGAISGISPVGCTNPSLSLPPVFWPDTYPADYNPTYRIGDTTYGSNIIATSTPTGALLPYSGNPAGVCYRGGDTTLSGDITITGMLAVLGDLTITAAAGVNNSITAVQGFPALLVRGNLILEPGACLTVNGLAAIEGEVFISGDGSKLAVNGAFFTEIGLWETAGDASGNGLTGTVYGGPTWDAGRVDGALALDGVDDYVDCGNDPGVTITTQITVAAWVKTNDVGNGQHNPFVSKGDRSYALKHNADGNIEFFIYDDTWQSVKYSPGSSFNGAWHHVAGTYDGEYLRLYIDGVQRASREYEDGDIDIQTYPLCIGHNAQQTDRFYNGVIDEVRIYSRALDAAEILLLHDNPGALGDPTGLRARYLFNEVGANVDIKADPAAAAIVLWDWHAGDMEWKGRHWGPAAGAFFRSVSRQ